MRDQVGGEDGIPVVNPLGQGTSPSQRTSQGHSHPMVRVLQQQIADLRAYSETLQTLVYKQNVRSVQYEVCSWQHIKPHMRMMSKQFLLGLDPERSKLKPLEEHIKESIFEVFDVPVHDKKQQKAFERSWIHEIRKKVLINLNNRRGRFSTNACLELWKLLGISKPLNATPEEMDTWKDKLKAIGVDMSWRIEGDDPYGADAFCGTIGYVKFGRNFKNATRLRLLPSQLAWFAYVLDLAMQGDMNMKQNGYHDIEIEEYKKDILRERHRIKKIELVTEREAEEERDVLFEEEEDDN